MSGASAEDLIGEYQSQSETKIVKQSWSGTVIGI